MKGFQWKRIGAMLLLTSLLLSLLTGCRWFSGSDSESGSQSGSQSTGSSTGQSTSDSKETEQEGEIVSYTVQVKSIGGMPMEDVGVYVYEDDTCQEMVWFERTDEEGKTAFEAPRLDTYVAVLDKVPQGYVTEESYPLTDPVTEIVLETKLLPASSLADTVFKPGDVMCDLSVTDVYGVNYTISQILKEKKAVVLNFWYLECDPCAKEFPYLQKAYDKYEDKLTVLALNPVDGTNATIREYAKEMELTLPMAVGDAALEKAFGISGYPTTVVIDRYGIISLVHKGSIPSTKNFKDLFKYYTSSKYEQIVLDSISQITVLEEEEEDDFDNPTEISGVTEFQITVKPGKTVYVDMYRMIDRWLQVKSNNVELIYDGNTYKPVNGEIGIIVNTPDTRTPVKLGIKNTGKKTETFNFTLSALPGSLDNPYPMSLGEFNTAISAGNEEGVYYRYIAEQDGYLTVQCLSVTAGIPYDYVLYNLTTYALRNLENNYVLDEDGNKVLQVKVSKGDEIQFIASTLPDAGGNYPAANFTFKAYMGEQLEDGDLNALKIDYAVTVTDENRNPIKGVRVNITGTAKVMVKDLENTKPGEEPKEVEKVVETKESMTTNDKGVAGLRLLPADYKVVITLPAGYTSNNTTLTLTEARPILAVKLDTEERASYTVNVVDELGNGIAGATLAIGDSYVTTGADGLAVFADMIVADYTVGIVPPNGYLADSPTYDFASGATSLTITLQTDVGGGQPDPNKTAYTVHVKDYYGGLVNGAMVVISDSNGVMVSSGITGADGVATIYLDPAEYTVTLGGAYQCITENATLTDTVTSAMVTAVAKRGSEASTVYDTTAYYLNMGATYVYDMQKDATTYFILKTDVVGNYHFKTSGNAVISGWGGTPEYIIGMPEPYSNTLSREVKGVDDKSVLVIGITGAEGCVIEITRTDLELSDAEKAEWIIWPGAATPADGDKYVPSVSGTLKFVDVVNGTTAGNTPVKGDDGFYHLGSKTGPVLYVALGSGNYRYVNFYGMLGFEQAGGTSFRREFYDADGVTFLKKEDYTACFKAYIAAANNSSNTYKIYPLNDDLIYMLQNGGAGKGWWDYDGMNYLFIGSDEEKIPVNDDIAWMFNVCYFE